MKTLFLKRTGGGLNNQKMIFLALLIEAIEKNSPIALPYFINFIANKSKNNLRDRFYFSYTYKFFHRDIDLFTVFDKISINTFFEKYNIKINNYITSRYTGKKLNPDKLFFKGESIVNEFIKNKNYEHRDIVADFFKYLIPSKYMEEKIEYFISHARPYDAVCQLRIESDWPLDIEDSWEKKPNEVNSTPLDRCNHIFSKIKKTLPSLKTLYITYDKSALTCSFEDIENLARDEFGFTLKEKHSAVNDEFNPKNALEASIIDFEIAARSDIFIGTDMSTFTSISAVTKFCRDGHPPKDRYLYNLPGKNLVPNEKF
ncbi:O-fucosyltransferase family protein [Pectobacterium actinidiae]|uniref:O-fucosyltransferase family protein n=1 Tax=Pectobacterium actinidiae TaxID=1507808 RepID=UPI0023AA2D83|nr:O-fucosyltransferase family protein [Pectobacterium actinidiae]WEF12286.1 O-fucosyltransferase family protein [Pectobacterium actinidiae]